MNLRVINAMLLCGPLLFAGCATTTREQTADQPDSVVLPFESPEAPMDELDADAVFSALVGEIATQRGDLETAYRHQLQTAVITGDAQAAERATRIALAVKRRDLALRAVKEWVRLAPNEVPARQLAVMLFLDDNQPEKVTENIQAILAVADSTGRDGFLLVMAALAKSRERDAGMRLMRQLAEAHPQDPRAGYATARLALGWKQNQVAEKEIRDVIGRHPKWGRAYVLLSRILVMKGDKDGALAVLEKAAARIPKDPTVNIALAKLLVDKGDYEKAYRQFLKVQRLTPEDPDIIYSLGVLAVQLDKPEAARRHFLQLRQNGEMPDQTSYYLGRLDEEKGKPDSAIGFYEQVGNGELRYEAQIRITRILAGQGRLDEARDRVRQLRFEMPEHSPQLYLAEAELMRKEVSDGEVMALYDKALAAHPDDIPILYARALFAVSIGRMDILEKDLGRVLELDPENVDALNALGYTLADQTDRYQEAAAYIKKAYALRPGEPAILDSMGWLEYRLGNHEEALGYLQQAMDKMPDSEIAAHLGEVLWVTGDRQQALKVWNRMLKKDPDSRHVRETRKRLTGN